MPNLAWRLAYVCPMSERERSPQAPQVMFLGRLFSDLWLPLGVHAVLQPTVQADALDGAMAQASNPNMYAEALIARERVQAGLRWAKLAAHPPGRYRAVTGEMRHVFKDMDRALRVAVLASGLIGAAAVVVASQLWPAVGGGLAFLGYAMGMLVGVVASKVVGRRLDRKTLPLQKRLAAPKV